MSILFIYLTSTFNKGVEVFAVGVGIRQDDRILKEIASEPKSGHFFSTPHPARLTDVLHVIKKMICSGRFIFSLYHHGQGDFISDTDIKPTLFLHLVISLGLGESR